MNCMWSCASRQLASQLRIELGSLAGRVGQSAILERGASGAGLKRLQRLRNLKRRHAKLCRIRPKLRVTKSKLGCIYTAGLRPGPTFGAPLNGFSDSELKQVCRILGSELSPSHRGTSLTFKLALHGDSVWKAAVAPALQWAAAVWSSINASPTATLDTPELAPLWAAARP